jgi:hypothetical protein
MPPSEFKIKTAVPQLMTHGQLVMPFAFTVNVGLVAAPVVVA